VLTALLALTLPVEFSEDAAFRSAYQSKGRLSEAAPIVSSYTKGGLDLGAFGRPGAFFWTACSLTDERADAHGRMFTEVDFGPYWGYDVAIADGWKWKNELSWWNITLPNMAEGVSDDNQYEVWWGTSLANKYVVPSLWLRQGVVTEKWTYFRVGLHRAFELIESVTLTPGLYAELGTEEFFRFRYGERAGGYPDRIASLIEKISLCWSVSKNLDLYAEVYQFDLVSKAVRDRTHSPCRRDHTYFIVGARLHF